MYRCTSARTPDRSTPVALHLAERARIVSERRVPNVHQASRPTSPAETGKVAGVVAAHSLTTLFYLLARWRSPEAARVHVVEHWPCRTRMLEDAVQMAAARQARSDYLVTRDRAGYAAGPIPAVTPAELLALL